MAHHGGQESHGGGHAMVETHGGEHHVETHHGEGHHAAEEALKIAHHMAEIKEQHHAEEE